MQTKTVYKKIQDQNGLAEFKSLVEKWEALSDHIEAKAAGVPVILPDLFLVSHSGTGRTHFLRLLSEYLSEKTNLMDFYGDVKYFEFMLNYCRPDEFFSELPRLMNEIDGAAGFRSEYRGIVFIDVDEWRGHVEEKHFVTFMEYLSDNSDDWLVVLSVSDDKPEQTRLMEAVVSAFLRIEKLTIEPPTVKELTDYAKELLKGYGITLKGNVERVIADSIDVLSQNKYFDGYKTVKMLCQDIAYSVYMDGPRGHKGFVLEDASAFAGDSEYVRRMTVRIERVKKIGFN